MTKLVLGIESSCDETAAAVVDEDQNVLSSVVATQVEAHAEFGGVVPDLAARMHTEAIGGVVTKALKDAELELKDISTIAVTQMPGLIGSLLVGVSFAEGLSLSTGLPLYGIDHIEGHIWSGFMQDPSLTWPLMALVVSGGHTALYRYDGLGQITMISRTVDDAAGEAFDKVAALLKLSYPGGPSVQKAAETGNPKAFKFPRGQVKKKPLHFSFSGLKTSVLYTLKGQDGLRSDINLENYSVPDVAASFQEAVVDALISKTFKALEAEKLKTLIVCGGVAANSRLRERLQERGEKRRIKVVVPPLKLCTDNAMMIAGLGAAYLKEGRAPDSIGLDAKARSSLSR
ncbi:MAG: tRNA (adenosine(37)-N6)-threonylcarbamoyltransferase complex transferase subunit TsaD [Planctomycetota bacterium]|nr:tRNA (adenosine(37)-N6)-threonylcarbamoyltransferase complex transferase subunit TsaD [Planctomycetota bacterium]